MKPSKNEHFATLLDLIEVERDAERAENERKLDLMPVQMRETLGKTVTRLVLVSSLSGSGAHNQVSVQYEKFSHGHLERNEQGGLQPAVESGWNFVENIPFSTNVDSDLF